MITGFLPCPAIVLFFFSKCTHVFLCGRFSSIGERLACYCGSSKCRGVVNDVESEERVKKLHVPSSELTDWKGE